MTSPDSEQASVALASHDPTAIGPLYRFLADQKFPNSPEKMVEVASQLSDVMHKAWTLLGIPPIIVALSALSKEHGKSHPGQGDLSAKWFVSYGPAHLFRNRQF